MNMAHPDAYRQYQTTQVRTAGPAQLTLMCYDGALRFLKQARAAMEARDYETQNAFIDKTQALLSELINGLDFAQGGDIARDLDRIYRYLHGRLTHATLRDDLAALDEARAHVTDLRDAWAQAMCQAGAAASAPPVASNGDGRRPALALSV
jgi:flagellar protein FliS